MKIALGSIELDDHARAALAHHYGLPGLAPRDTCRNFVRSNGELALDDVCAAFDEWGEHVRKLILGEES